MKQSAGAKQNLEVEHFRSKLVDIDSFATAFILAVTLDVHKTIEVGINKVYFYKNAIGKAVNL